MNKWCVRFWNEHGDRLIFIGLSGMFASFMYWLIPSTREQVVAIYFLLLGLLVNKARTPKEEPIEPKTD